MTTVAAPPAGPLSGPVGRRLAARRAEVLAALSRGGVGSAQVFGSVARGDDGADSDVDLLVEFPPGTSLFDVFRLQAELEAILEAEVDLVSSSDLKPAVRPRVEQDLVAL